MFKIRDYTTVISILILSFIFHQYLIVNAELEGPNVCKRQEEYTVSVVTTESQAYQERANTWCWSVPPRCSQYKIKFRTVNKTQILPKSRIVKECCKGYGLNLKGDQCIAVCTNKCINGVCVAPDTCQCEPGYGGPSCDISKYI